MSSTIIIKNSAVSGSVPSTLTQGEMAINVTNGRLFYGSGSAGTVKEFNLTSSISASYALTASYALNAGTSTAVSASLFVYTQSAAATTWSINHNLDELYPLVNVYSSSFAIIPSQIKSIDVDNIEIYFATATSGYATILGKAVFIEGTVTSASYAATASYVNTLRQPVIISGSLNITGSTTQVGSNTLLGSTTLSGSIIISGSITTPTTPTIKIYGDMETNGVIKFDPVVKDIDITITGSYVYVSGSTNDLYFTQNGDGYANTTRLRWLEGNLYTGLLNGGLITSASSTTFNISSGSGIIVNLNASLNTNPYPTITYVNWGNLTGQTLTYRTSSIQTFLGIDASGSIIQQTTPWTDGQYNTSISLGTVLHQNLSTINGQITYPNVAYGYKQRTYDFIKAFGPLKLTGYAINTSSSLGLTVGSGTAFADGRNYQTDPNNPSYITDPGTTVSKIFRYYQSGSSFVQDTNAGAGYTVIDPANYNPGNSGSITSVPGGQYTVQRVFWYPNSATKGIVVYYGNTTYNSISNALANYANETFNETENTKQNAIYLGAIIIKSNGAFTTSADYQIITAGLFRSITAGIGGGGGGSSAAFPYTGSAQITGSLTVAGPINAISFTGSLFGTASYSTQALSASYASNVLKTKSGVIANTSFTGNPKTATVTFASEFADDSYAVTITGEDARTWTIESKVFGSFIVNTNSDTGLTGNTYWIATAYGEN